MDKELKERIKNLEALHINYFKHDVENDCIVLYNRTEEGDKRLGEFHITEEGCEYTIKEYMAEELCIMLNIAEIDYNEWKTNPRSVIGDICYGIACLAVEFSRSRTAEAQCLRFLFYNQDQDFVVI